MGWSMGIDTMHATCDYWGMQRTTTAPHQRDDVANVARYDDRLARDIAQRERDAQLAQRERDARRAAYDHAMANAPSVARVLADYRATRESPAQRALRERMARQNVGRSPKNTPVRTPNLWERDAPRDVHRETDRACHHPLVKCAHKW
jgi:hypothetical protein